MRVCLSVCVCVAVAVCVQVETNKGDFFNKDVGREREIERKANILRIPIIIRGKFKFKVSVFVICVQSSNIGRILN